MSCVFVNEAERVDASELIAQAFAEADQTVTGYWHNLHTVQHKNLQSVITNFNFQNVS